MATYSITGAVAAKGRSASQVITYLAATTQLESMLDGFVLSRATVAAEFDFATSFSITGDVNAVGAVAASFAYTGSAVVSGNVDAEGIIAATFVKGKVVLADINAEAVISGGVVITYASPSTTALNAIVLNAETLYRSHYANFAFDSLISYKGNLYGTLGGILYQLTGTTDAGTAIATTARTGQSDFGIIQKKNVREVYVNVKTASAMTMKSITDNATESATAPLATTTGITGISPRKVRFPFSRISRQWGFEIANVSGAASEIESIHCTPDSIQREI